uniref:Uncharacterized protein n=1 Tax=Sinocyclocheilus anshuiensis TaxID=1608454 RepID=A0A671KBM2_9TELE
MFVQHKVWHPVKWWTCDLRLSEVQLGCTGHWERFKKRTLHTPGSAHKTIFKKMKQLSFNT